MTRPDDDEDDDWKPPANDPDVIENAKRQLRSLKATQMRLIRWAYLVIAILVIVLIVVLATR